MTMDDILRQQAFSLMGDVQTQVKNILEHYTADDEDRANPAPKELPALLKRAAACLDEPYQDMSQAELIWSDVLSLGRVAGVSREAGQEIAAAVSETLASAFSIDGSTFALRYSSFATPRFSIGLQKGRNGTGATPSKIAGSVLRSACRYAEVTPSGEEVEAPILYTAHAVCRMRFMNNNESEQKLTRSKIVNWVDSAAAACPDRRYSVTLRFSPIRADWIDEKLEAAHHLQSWLETYSEASWQSSGNMNYNESSDPMLVAAYHGLVDGGKGSGSYGMGTSLSRTLHNAGSRDLAEQLKYLCARLIQMRRTSGYAVSIELKADKEITLSMIKGAATGTFAVNNIDLRWVKQKKDSKPLIVPAHGLDLLVCMPSLEFSGFSLRDIEEYKLRTPNSALGVMIGKPYWNEVELKGQSFVVPYSELNRHTFVCGMTGSGKSNTTCYMLSRMDRPFIVIEPVKGEYRSLRDSMARKTLVYTMNVSGNDMLPVNPLWFPEGGNLQYHIDSIKAIISSAFDLYAAMPSILEQCLLRAYVHAGWNLITNRNIYEGRLPSDWLYPTISDLCEEIENYLNHSDFEGEAKGNYKGALLSRLQSFTSGAKGVLLNVPAHMPFQDWLENDCNVVIELDALADDADKCIVMGTMLTQYFQYVKYRTVSSADIGLKHVMVLEEAHHLFPAEDSSKDGSSSRKQMVDSLSNLLAEIRAYGEGVIIVDQSPTRISPEVIKNTAVKIIHRVDYGKDIEILRDALLLREGDKTISRLNQGQALIRFGDMDKPGMVQVERCEEKEAFQFGGRDARPDAESLVHSAKDLVLMHEVFRIELIQACKLFLNQVLFDRLPTIRRAYLALWLQVDMFIKQHGYQEMIQSVNRDDAIRAIIQEGIQRAARATYPDQKYLCGIIRMYVDRYLALEMQGDMTEKEWRMLEDYRSVQIHSRLTEFYNTSMQPIHIALRGVTKATLYFGLLSELIDHVAPLKELLKDRDDSRILDAGKEAEARALISGQMCHCFYFEPREELRGLLESILIQYYRRAPS